MLIDKYSYGYSNKKKYIIGRGFADSLSTVFNSIRGAAGPALKTIGNYVVQNRDLIAKPLLGAIGSLAATGLTAGIPAIIKHIASRNKGKIKENNVEVLADAKYKEILQTILEPRQSTTNPVTNIIGSGIKSF